VWQRSRCRWFRRARPLGGGGSRGRLTSISRRTVLLTLKRHRCPSATQRDCPLRGL
jgi:hypothetical protein